MSTSLRERGCSAHFLGYRARIVTQTTTFDRRSRKRSFEWLVRGGEATSRTKSGRISSGRIYLSRNSQLPSYNSGLSFMLAGYFLASFVSPCEQMTSLSANSISVRQPVSTGCSSPLLQNARLKIANCRGGEAGAGAAEGGSRRGGSRLAAALPSLSSLGGARRGGA